jgi:molybdopterin-binding protein
MKVIKDITKDLVGVLIDSKNLQQRGIADKIEDIVCSQVMKLKSSGLAVEAATSKRSIEDIQIKEGANLYKIDIKSHDVNSDFSMPNLVSIDRLRKFYEKDTNFLVYIFVDYKTVGTTTTIEKIEVRLVEELDWSILAIQNLGKGQLQIKNMNSELIFTTPNRDEWLSVLKTNAIDYYNKLVSKVERYKKEWS